MYDSFSERQEWMTENMPHFIYNYECGTNPTNFHVLKIEKKPKRELKGESQILNVN
jgi:hypothetical protein